jgi:hypothetical protein
MDWGVKGKSGLVCRAARNEDRKLLRLLVSCNDAPVGRGESMGEIGKAGCGQEIEDFFLGVALAFGDGHEEGGIGGDREGTGFVGVDVGVMDHNNSA